MGRSAKRVREVEEESDEYVSAEDNLDEMTDSEGDYDDDDDGGGGSGDGSEMSADSDEQSLDDGQEKVVNAMNKGEIEELEKEYMSLRHNEQDLLANLKRQKSDDALKGQAVKNQKTLWNKSLEARILLQKAFSSSNRLPKEPVRSLFITSDVGVSEAYSDLISSSEKTIHSLLELQNALLENNPSITDAADGNSQSSKNKMHEEIGSEEDETWKLISQIQSRIAPFKNKSIDKWQRKTDVTTGAASTGKYQAFNQNISQQVAAYMRDPSRMVKQMQVMKSTVSIFGAVPEEIENVKEEGAEGDPDLLDDSNLYQLLLKEFFETIDLSSTDAAALSTLKRSQVKKRKIVDRRASKSRKIRYDIHEKIVNFMAPEPANIPPMASKLFEDLFGLKTRMAAST